MALWNHTALKMKFFIKDYVSKCDQIRSLLKKSLMQNFIFLIAQVFEKDFRIGKKKRRQYSA